jgi:putative hydrolase of the HAD superfamily
LNTNHNDIKAVFFDAGGTLLHLDSSCIRNLLRDALNIDINLDKFRYAQSLAMSRVADLVAAGAGSTEQLKREFYTTLLPETGVSEEQLSDAVECTFKLAREEMLWRRTEEGTAHALDDLKRAGYILAVVSNSDGRIERAFEQAGINGYFDFFIDSYNVGFEKPDPEIFLLATERAMVDPKETAYVGDLYWVDVVGARNAGLIPILYDPFNFNRDPDCVTIRSLSELRKLLQTG